MSKRLVTRAIVGVLYLGTALSLAMPVAFADISGRVEAVDGANTEINTEIKTATLFQPNPDWQAREVVSIQLNALKDNDSPTKDSGIEQVWAFAHPQNKSMTGPLPRFAQMIRSPGYAVLVDHRRHEISEVRETLNNAVFLVRVLARDGSFYGFQWQLRKAALEAGPSWMTTRVSAARTTGEQLSKR